MRSILATLLLLILATASLSQVKKPEPAPVKPTFERSQQIVVVTTNDWGSVSGTARLFERKNEREDWKAVGDSFPVVVGRNGLAWDSSGMPNPKASKIKHEGDGSAPAGLFPLTTTFGIGVKPNEVELPYTRLDKFTECVDDVNSSHYNKIVNRVQVGNFDWKSSEKMLNVMPEYELGAFVAYNTYPVQRGNGSCIFLHIWKDAATGTAGCTAMERRHLERIVGWLAADKNPYLVQMVKSDYDHIRKIWKLPKIK
jgi:D-alanyl-D-alanine dipeptidase